MALDDLSQTLIDALDDMFNHTPAMGKSRGAENPNLGTLLQTLIDESKQGTIGDVVDARVQPAVATVAALKAVDTATLTDGAVVVILADSSVWVYDADSAAVGDDTTVIDPTSSGNGRWLVSSTAAAALFGVAGTSTASKALVLDAQKATDTLRATGNVTVGGTGVPGAAGAMTSLTKNVTAFLDTTAKAIFTVTIPNTAQACRIEVDVEAALGAGGAIGAGESTMATKYIVTLAKTANKAVVAGVSAVIGAANAKVAGADDITSAVVTTGNITGGTGANTIDINLAITRAGAGATNHTAVVAARLLNQNATGITIA